MSDSNSFVGRSEDEILAAEEARLMRAAARSKVVNTTPKSTPTNTSAPNTVTSQTVTPNKNDADEERRRREAEQKRIQNLDAEQLRKVMEAQKFLDEREKNGEIEVKMPTQNVPPQNPDGPERKILSFELPASKLEARKQIELAINQNISHITITPLASIYDSTITLIVQGPNIKFLAEHDQISRDDQNEYTSHMKTVQGLTIPFGFSVTDLRIVPKASGGLSVEVAKPKF
eukprot:TRINITY_DN2244_c0_g1_i1.p1 TRINITY_DN2244_c0_g1~~TRINITY_DN2244_c0_g1_i1.p1  ORF type:complete len:265 (+),score=56.28 TRINITY_DN2244_c0_g1_i1:103-795(+)